MNKLELYFHIPFCVRKCLYCDFLSAPADKSVQDAYMEALIRETACRAGEYENYLTDTVFLGGGTPSVVDAGWIEKLLDTVHREFAVSDRAEITMEVNPGTVDSDRLRRYKKAGVNRLSIGLQSADNGELKRIGRIHSWEDFEKTYRLARQAGFANVNVDVMSALPGQNTDSYGNTLQKVLALNPQPEHISSYSLIVEEGTPFFQMQEENRLLLPDEDEERLMYEQTRNILEQAGYIRYEISNYAKEGYECRHNCGYWRRTEYAGFGIGAASLVGETRFQNGNSLSQYLDNPLKCRSAVQQLGEDDCMEEFMFLGLRMTAGVSMREFQERFGRSMNEVYREVIRKNCDDGLLYVRDCTDGDRRVALTKRGLDLSNYVMAQFLMG